MNERLVLRAQAASTRDLNGVLHQVHESINPFRGRVVLREAAAREKQQLVSENLIENGTESESPPLIWETRLSSIQFHNVDNEASSNRAIWNN